MVIKLHSAVRGSAFWLWVSGGFGGVFPDVDHLPMLVTGERIGLPVIGKLNQLIGVTPDGYGRPLHALFLIIGVAWCWIYFTRLCRRIQSGILAEMEVRS